jgi:ankyrin repeat protein
MNPTLSIKTCCSNLPKKITLNCYSISSANKSSVSLLLALVDVNQIDITGRTPIFYAAEQGHAIFCQELVSMGALCTIKDHLGNTPVSYARKIKHYSLVKYLMLIKRRQYE